MGNGIEMVGRAAPVRLPVGFASWLRARVALTGVIAAGVGVPLIVTLSTGAFGLPHVDDWAYFRTDATLLHTGHVQLVGLGPMTLVGHLVWGLPFLAILGSSVAAVHWAGTVASAVGLWAAYVLFRRFVPKPFALFGTAVLAAWPVFAGLATTFMTDNTALAAQLVCLALGVTALDRTGPARTRMLAASLAAGFLGFAIREPSIAAPLAVLAGHVVAARREGRSIARLGGALAGFLVLCGALWTWRQGLQHSQVGGVTSTSGFLSDFGKSAVSKWVAAFFVVAFAVAPALALSGRTFARFMRRPAWAAVAGATILVAVERLVSRGADGSSGVLLGWTDGVSRYPLDSKNGGLPPIVPDAAWALVLAAAIAGGACLTVLLVEHAASARRQLATRRLDALSPRAWMMVVFGALAAALVIGRAAGGAQLYDRYLLPVVAAVLLLVLVQASRVERPAWTAGGVVLAAMALFALVYVADTSSRMVARWHAADRLVAAGYRPTDVEAGFEWVGLHYPGAAQDRTAAARKSPRFSHGGMFPLARVYALVSNARLHVPGLRLLGTESYRAGLGLREETMWLYRNERAGVPRGGIGP